MIFLNGGILSIEITRLANLRSPTAFFPGRRSTEDRSLPSEPRHFWRHRVQASIVWLAAFQHYRSCRNRRASSISDSPQNVKALGGGIRMNSGSVMLGLTDFFRQDCGRGRRTNERTNTAAL